MDAANGVYNVEQHKIDGKEPRPYVDVSLVPDNRQQQNENIEEQAQYFEGQAHLRTFDL